MLRLVGLVLGLVAAGSLGGIPLAPAPRVALASPAAQQPAHVEAGDQAGAGEHAAPAEHAAGEEHGEFEMQEYALHHLADSRTLDFSPLGEIHLPRIQVGPLDLSITKHVVFLWIAAALLVVIFVPMARVGGPVRRGLFNFMEAMVVYVRDQIAVPNIGREHATRFVPYLLTLFFFVLAANLLGLLPFGASATGNVNVTGALALLTMFVAEGASLRQLGPSGYVRQFVPIEVEARGIVGKALSWGLLVPLLFAIEIISHVVRIFALMIRLFANMVAGHMMILALLGLIFLFRTYLVAPPSVGAAAAVYLLEVFIGLVQAFIFTFLTSLFIGMGLHAHH
jgi:F-type H+-transporting ATPase subunit a